MFYPCQINIEFPHAMKYEIPVMKKAGPERSTYSVRLRPSLIKSLRHAAVEEERPFSELLEQAIEDFLAKYEQARQAEKGKKGKRDSGR
jgi:predicted transcriptional regulator